MDFFSDRNNDNRDTVLTETINVDIWNGYVALLQQLLAAGTLAKSFPLECPDGKGIYSSNPTSFEKAVKSVIPSLIIPIECGSIIYANPWGNQSQESVDKQNTYNLLDLIEYVFCHITDVKQGAYHEFYRHYELLFENTTFARSKYIEDVNTIFYRNNLAFTLTEEGKVERILNANLQGIIANQPKVAEDTLSELLKIAIDKIRNPKLEERQLGLEKLWDAFERMKTCLNPGDKKDSVDKLLIRCAKEEDGIFEMLEEECRTLTRIGNQFQIRHYEMNVPKIEKASHIDYLFSRLYSLIHLFIPYISQEMQIIEK